MRPPNHHIFKGLPIQRENPSFALGYGCKPSLKPFEIQLNSFNIMNNATVRPNKVAIPLIEVNRHKNMMKPGDFGRSPIRVTLPRMKHVEVPPLVKTFE